MLEVSLLAQFKRWGADPEGPLGERHEPETHLIPLVLQAASGRRPHISVFGRDYDTPDGTCIRDYVHIADLCEAHWLALQSLMNGGQSQAYNLGNGNGFSVQEVIDTAEAVTGRNINWGHKLGSDPNCFDVQGAFGLLVCFWGLFCPSTALKEAL